MPRAKNDIVYKKGISYTNMDKKFKYVLITSFIACALLYYVEQVIKVNYLAKTFIKVILFTTIHYIYIKLYKKSTFKSIFNCKKIDKEQLKIGVILGIMSFLIILIIYFILRDVIDLQGIAHDLQNKSKVTPANFILVAFHITFGNSFLEEFFFRGFIFLNLYELKFKKTAYVYSSLLFALYHIAIFKSWFNIWLILLALTGLISVGFIFNFIDTKSNNFINSWIVHILADMAIMLIGMKMFGIIL